MNEQSKPRILIAEDDFENQKFLQLLLKKDFDVETCDSETSFYQLLHKSKFDVIMVDISLRGLKNGLEITKELKSLPEYQKIPVVCLTAHAFREDKKNAMEAGVDIFLTKPIENNVLLNVLLDIIAKKN